MYNVYRQDHNDSSKKFMGGKSSETGICNTIRYWVEKNSHCVEVLWHNWTGSIFEPYATVMFHGGIKVNFYVDRV